MGAHLKALKNSNLARADRECGKMGLRLGFLDRQSLCFARCIQWLVDASEASFPRFGVFQSAYRSATAQTKSSAG
jgi:hypothetical protein